jgi:hypothetical protein
VDIALWDERASPPAPTTRLLGTRIRRLVDEAPARALPKAKRVWHIERYVSPDAAALIEQRALCQMPTAAALLRVVAKEQWAN